MKLDTDKIVRRFEEDPATFMAASAGLLMAIGHIIKAVGDSRGSHAYARDVNRRVRKEKRGRGQTR